MLPNTNGLEDSSVAKLFDNFASVKSARAAQIIGLDTSDELGSSRHHFLQKVHQRVSEVRGHRLLGPRLRGEPAAAAALLGACWTYAVYWFL